MPTEKANLALAVGLFALCAGATLISFQAYTFTWDDADYLQRSFAVSRAFWAADPAGLAQAMPGIRPPIMTLLGIPWGTLHSWHGAGQCFLSLVTLEFFFVALCLALLLRLGLSPRLLALGSLCLLAALGPFPTGSLAHSCSTAFLADSLFAWVCFATVLLVPYERHHPIRCKADGLWRGMLWGMIVSTGLLTKTSFLYFVFAVMPILAAIQRRSRAAPAAWWSFFVVSSPTLFYWFCFGRPALLNGWNASFGKDAPFYFLPLVTFLRFLRRNSPGMALSGLLAVGVLAVLAWRRLRGEKSIPPWEFALPPIVVTGYLLLVLASPNREVRFLFPVLVSTPYLLGLLLTPKGPGLSRKRAGGAAVAVFFALMTAGWPVRTRPDRGCLHLCELVLTQANRKGARRVLLASDSPSLNLPLLQAAVAISTPDPGVKVDCLACTFPPPFEEDARRIRHCDLLVIQDAESWNPPWTNTRGARYENYTRALGACPETLEGIQFYAIPKGP